MENKGLDKSTKEALSALGFHVKDGKGIDKEAYDLSFGEGHEAGELWDFTLEDCLDGAIEGNPEMVYWFFDGRVWETTECEEME